MKSKPKSLKTKTDRKTTTQVAVQTVEKNVEKPEGYVFGRPTKYKKEYCDMLVEHLSNGLSYEAFAGLIRVSKDTLYEWEKEHKDFSDAKEVGTSAGQLFWEKLGIDNIINQSDSHGMGISSSRSLNGQVWSMNMINRFKWRRQQKDEATVNVQVNNYEKLDDAQLDQELAARLAKLKGEQK